AAASSSIRPVFGTSLPRWTAWKATVSVSSKWPTSRRDAASRIAATCASRDVPCWPRWRAATSTAGVTRATSGYGDFTRSNAKTGALSANRNDGEMSLRQHGVPARQRMGERAAVDILELATDRHAMGDSAGTYASATRQLAQEVRR